MSNFGRRRTVFVYADWAGLDGPVRIGTLFAELLRGKEVFSFSYDGAWLKRSMFWQLDPDLSLFTGLQFLSDAKPNFGAFLDSSPDRWGRVLMRRREALLARREHRAERTLFESDYLLGVFDGHRMGGLRFKVAEDGPFLDASTDQAVPPWTSLRDLEAVSLRLEEDGVERQPDFAQWLHMLVAPGASLGGARPKASVCDASGALWIAKFPSRSDGYDVGAWEWVTHRCAVEAGIEMAECRVQAFSSAHQTFLTRRFDRSAMGERVHFASAMTLLGKMDGQWGASYLDLVDFITSHGGRADADLEQLWRRMVFNMCVSNADDHLRNHGFLLRPEGWVLSPAYDLNPVESAAGLTLNVSGTDNSLDLRLALEVAPAFRLKQERALAIVGEVLKGVRKWRDWAGERGIAQSECRRMGKVFERLLGFDGESGTG